MTKIQTKVKGRNDWIDCDHDGWLELIRDGWNFVALNQDSHAIMSRKGYLNVFRNKPETEILKSRIQDKINELNDTNDSECQWVIDMLKNMLGVEE